MALADEARQAAAGARRQLATCGPVLAELERRIRARPPRIVVTCARGSSDHAATYGKYVIETTSGHVVASVGPSVATIYQRELVGLDDALFLAVSQSGRSPDVIRLAEMAGRGGALVVGLVNDETSPLAHACELVMPLCAGEEHAIAATKSFLLAGLGLLQIASVWAGDRALADAVLRAPDALEAACTLDWTPALARLAGTTNLYVIGRGPGFGVTLEVALKLKETCGLHAEAFSTAEVMHGPIALVDAGFPVIALGQEDATAAGTREVVARLVALGAEVVSTLPVEGALALPTVSGVPAVLAPLCFAQSLYVALPALAQLRGRDVDAPRHLHKITETI